jgi:predicted nucleotide-binding protein
MTIRPKTFVGSSTEGLHVAKAIESNLSEVTDVMVWTDGVFLPGRTFVETLEKLLEEVDYAILVATPDDLLVMREVENFSMRDNVLLELGLFMAKLGRRRTYLVTPKSKPIRIPTDLLGVKTVNFDLAPGAELSTVGPALEEACDSIRRAMQDAEKDLSNAMRRSLIKNLLVWTTKVHEMVSLAQAESVKSLLNRTEFERVRKETSVRLTELLNERREDAAKLRITEQYDRLRTTLATAIDGLPFPEEAVISNSDAMSGLLSHLVGGNSIQDQFKKRIDSIAARYDAWWNKHRAEIAKDLRDFQAELIKQL